MNLPPRTLVLKNLVVKEKAVLALDTGFDAESLEGLRLVKASRGSGWLYRSGRLQPWVTRGVLQEDKRLVIWGDLEDTPTGASPAAWPVEGEAARDFLRAFILAWTARAALAEPLSGFTSSSVVPFQTDDGWAFAFPPPELRAVLDSLQPLGDRLAWDHFKLPDETGAASWAFTSAALALNLITGSLPWTHEDDAHLRQEIRDLKKSLSADELPHGPDAETLKLWLESLTGRAGPQAGQRWQQWATGNPSWTVTDADPGLAQKRTLAATRRTRRRSGAAFWRRRGTVTTVVASAVVLVLLFVGSIAWGLLKPDATDHWTPRAVVEGYFEGLNGLDADLMARLTRFDGKQQAALVRDKEEVTNLYVIRQVRTAYEHATPIDEAEAWEAAGRPPLAEGRILYGVAGLELTGQDQSWTARYRKWISESEEGKAPQPLGVEVVDKLTLNKTDRGWKITAVVRQRQPLP